MKILTSPISRDNENVEIGKPTRIAADIEILGRGKALVRVWWTFSKAAMREVIQTLRDSGLPKTDVKVFGKLLNIECTAYAIEVDLNKDAALTIQEFESRLKSYDEEYAFYLMQADSFLKTREFTDGEKPYGLLEYAYKLYRATRIQTLVENKPVMDAKFKSRQGSFSRSDISDMMEASKRVLDV